MSPNPPRLRLPTLEAGFGPQDLLHWLDKCEDAFESHEEQLGEGETCHVKTKIREAGMKMEGEGEVWWSLNRAEVKALASWEAFVEKVKGRFLPAGWALQAEHKFFGIRQTADFASFASSLLAARHEATSNISDHDLKRHLLHHSHPLLYLHVASSTTFSLAALSFDELANHMGMLWEGLALEGGTSRTTRPTALAAPSTLPATGGRLPPLSDADRLTMRAEGRCFKCRKIGHSLANCPGDAALGIPPAVARVKYETAARMEEEDEDECSPFSSDGSEWDD